MELEMRKCGMFYILILIGILASSISLQAQTPASSGAAKKTAASFDPKDIFHRWVRTSPFESFSNVPGGANEFQNEITLGKTPDLSKGKYEEHEAPFTPAGKAAFDKNIPSYGIRITAPRLGNDPQGMCDPWGVPRMLNGQVKGPHASIAIFKFPDGRVMMFSQWHHDWRIVWTDGRKLPSLDEVEPKWNGYSVGHWEGDTFVVNSVGFDERTWLDHNGYPHTEEMKLEERYRRVSADTLELVMTVTDPEYYSKPFVSDTKQFKLDLAHEKDWDEQIYCVPSEEFRFNKLIRDGNVGKVPER